MIYVIIVGMALVTMIPRFVPAFIMDKLELRNWMHRWLNAIPYAALGALIFTGILSVIAADPHIWIADGIVIMVHTLLGWNIILVVVGSIGAVFILLLYVNVSRVRL